MTAPTGDDALREALNLALKDTQRQHGWLLATGILADDLLPVVLRYGREKAAAELRAAADDHDDEAAVWRLHAYRERSAEMPARATASQSAAAAWETAGERLRARAAALAPENARPE